MSSGDAPTAEVLAHRLATVLHSLDDSKKQLVLACLDCITAPPAHNNNNNNNNSPQPDLTELMALVLAHTAGADSNTIAQAAAALQTFRSSASTLSAPSAPLGYHIPSSARARKTDAPLQGMPLLDGQTLSWAERLNEKAVGTTTNNNNNLPLIRNYGEACRVFAEYASLGFKPVPDDNAADFPADEAEQRVLATRIYEAIIDMEGILEAKPPLSLKRAGGGGGGSVIGDSSDNNSDGGSIIGGSNLAISNDNNANNNVHPPPKTKETISVTKVKGLARIEVWLLSWMILFSTHDIHRGRLPFLHWSKSDWGWDGGFATFHDRLDAVITTLRGSKAAVCSLLESDYKARLEAHPTREYRRKENNRSQNAERNAQVFLGRHAISTGQVKRDAGGHLCDWNGNVVVAATTANHCELIEQTVKLSSLGQQRTKPGAGGGGGGGGGAVAADPAARKRKPRQPAHNAKRAKKDHVTDTTAAAASETAPDLSIKADVANLADVADTSNTGQLQTPLAEDARLPALLPALPALPVQPVSGSATSTTSSTLPLTPQETPRKEHKTLSPRAVASAAAAAAAAASMPSMPSMPSYGYGYGNYAPAGQFADPFGPIAADPFNADADPFGTLNSYANPMPLPEFDGLSGGFEPAPAAVATATTDAIADPPLFGFDHQLGFDAGLLGGDYAGLPQQQQSFQNDDMLMLDAPTNNNNSDAYDDSMAYLTSLTGLNNLNSLNSLNSAAALDWGGFPDDLAALLFTQSEEEGGC